MKKRQFKYLFGPVPSRRLGISLGVDLLPPKTCSLDCVYCECGVTTCLTMERKEWVPLHEVKEELSLIFEEKPPLDYITLSGFGEPTLHSGLEELVSFIKKTNYKIALLTNGSFLFDESSYEAIKNVDLLKVSIDAVTQEAFEKVNRPAKGFFLELFLSKFKEFSLSYKGRIWIEVFLVPHLNTHDSHLELLGQYLQEIQCERVQLNSLDRPPAEGFVQPLSPSALLCYQKYLQSMLSVPIDIVSRQNLEKASFNEEYMNLLLQAIRRRPLNNEDLFHLFGEEQEKAKEYLKQKAFLENGFWKIQK